MRGATLHTPTSAAAASTRTRTPTSFVRTATSHSVRHSRAARATDVRAARRREPCYLLLTMGAAESRILAEALELSEGERLRIAEALLHSVAPGGVASAEDPGTAAELRRRVAEIEAGDRAGVSWAELKDTIERE
jgi:putative addiction module component (TIGR02574 family)